MLFHTTEKRKNMFGAKIKSKIDIKRRVAICPYPFYLLKETAISKKEFIKIIVKTIKKIQKIKEINFS